jgi:hypothetical protein
LDNIVFTSHPSLSFPELPRAQVPEIKNKIKIQTWLSSDLINFPKIFHCESLIKTLRVAESFCL